MFYGHSTGIIHNIGVRKYEEPTKKERKKEKKKETNKQTNTSVPSMKEGSRHPSNEHPIVHSQINKKGAE